MSADPRPADQPHPFALPQALRELAEVVAEPNTVADVLKAVSEHLRQLLPVDAVGVLLQDPDGGLVVAASSDEIGRQVEVLEADLGEGPCTRSLETGMVITAPDLAASADEYPSFAPAATDLGVGAIHALPMAFRSDQVGALDLVACEPRELSAEDLAVGQLMADVTTSYVMNSRMLQQQTELAGHLRKALDTRIVVEQAKGVLAERHGITDQAAFERLRAYARDHRRRLGGVAGEVLAGDLRL